jgi:hypothetical protein
MRFALFNHIKTEATKGAIGICPNCGSKLIAKCGDIKINHWSHVEIATVIHGGRMKLIGIVHGKEIFQKIGRKLFIMTIKERNI